MTPQTDDVARALTALDAVQPEAGRSLEQVADALERVADAVDAELGALRARVPRAVADG